MRNLNLLTILTLSLLLISAAAALPALADGETADNEIPPLLIDLYLEAQDEVAQEQAEADAESTNEWPWQTGAGEWPWQTGAGEWPWQTEEVGVGIDPMG